MCNQNAKLCKIVHGFLFALCIVLCLKHEINKKKNLTKFISKKQNPVELIKHGIAEAYTLTLFGWV